MGKRIAHCLVAVMLLLHCVLPVYAVGAGAHAPLRTANCDDPSAAATPQYTMETERIFYDSSIQQITYSIHNNTDQEIGYGMGESLERLEGHSWVPVEMKPMDGVKLYPDIACIIEAHQGQEETLSLKWYQQPLKPGRYRILKRIGEDLLKGEFTVLDSKNCLTLPEPKWVTVSLPIDGKERAFTLGPQEYPNKVDALWHELLAFQRGEQPVGLPDAPAATLEFTTANRRVRSLSLWQSGGRVWTEMDAQWYYLDDPAIFSRLQALGKLVGANFPATGEELLAALQEIPPLRSVQFVPHDFTTPFAYPGWQSNLKESGVTLSIFQFPSTQELTYQMNYLYDGGYTVGIRESIQNGVVSSVIPTYHWVDPPHYFKAGARLVLYNGSDQAILTALTDLLGPEVQPVT